MERTVVLLMAWSPELGAPRNPVGVLGIDAVGDKSEIILTWLPGQDPGEWFDRVLDLIHDRSHWDDYLRRWARGPASYDLVEATPEASRQHSSLTDTVRAVIDDVLVDVARSDHG